MVVCDDRLEVMGKCPIASTTLGRQNNSHPCNNSFNFTFPETYYDIPVTLWTYDPFNKLSNDDPHRNYFDIIDRN